MEYVFASRMEKTPRSFIREILKVTQSPDIISFAGGLPNPSLFPVDELAESAQTVIAEEGRSALQYATTEGHPPLRDWIAKRYKTRLGVDVSPDEILITNGSQQCLDLIGKIFINPGSSVAIERPGYLGAIQAFSMYQPEFSCVPLTADGPDIHALSQVLKTDNPSFFYGVPNSQNPSGVTWSDANRKKVGARMQESETILIEDDAYGELRFRGEVMSSMRSLLPDLTVMTGSFSKIIAPGMRMGWVCAPEEIIEQAVTAKQGTDLHSNVLSQQIITRFLANYSIDEHISRITSAYASQCDCMLAAIKDEFPQEITYTRPDGGMFIWVTLPDGYSSTALFERALKENVAILPGTPFYTDGGGETTMRLNFSNSTPDRIEEGISRLGRVLRQYLNESPSSYAS
ncbi:MAG: PLP-dependent aminotransferase family protein [Methanobacteriota archaeon]